MPDSEKTVAENALAVAVAAATLAAKTAGATTAGAEKAADAAAAAEKVVAAATEAEKPEAEKIAAESASAATLAAETAAVATAEADARSLFRSRNWRNSESSAATGSADLSFLRLGLASIDRPSDPDVSNAAKSSCSRCDFAARSFFAFWDRPNDIASSSFARGIALFRSVVPVSGPLCSDNASEGR